MKKQLLLTAALTVACSAFAFMPKGTPQDSENLTVGPLAPQQTQSIAGNTRASGTMQFTYSDGEVYSELSLNNTVAKKTRAFMMFRMKDEDIQRFKGNRVTGFTTVNPTGNNQTANTIKSARLFVTTDITKEPEYTQDVNLSSTPFAYLHHDLDTAYEITGDEKELYFGYSLVVESGMYYVPVDYVATDYADACLIAAADDGSLPAADAWFSAAEAYGSIVLMIDITGDNLPEDAANVSGISAPGYIPFEGGANWTVQVRNNAMNDMTSFELTTSVAGMPDVVESFNCSPTAFNGTVEVNPKNVIANTTGFVDMTTRITKVNGKDYDGTGVTVSVPAYATATGFDSKIVVEDFTGTWCGWCPGGIEALEYFKKAGGDRAVCIAAHWDDLMQCDDYGTFIQNTVSGFPNLKWMRTFEQTPTSGYSSVCDYVDAVIDYYNYPSYCEVDLSQSSVTDNKLSIKSVSEFCVPTTIPHYIGFIITENHVGPYLQSNYFASQGIPMNGWESKGSSVPTIYDDVARYYNKYPGITAFPSSITAGSKMEYNLDVNLNNVELDGDAFTLIAIITNGRTGQIVNAQQIDLSKNGAGVQTVEFDENAPVKYYNLQGIEVANPVKGQVVIKTQGNKVAKVVAE